ncbi:hypothetical protein SOPP22_15935, partial [Shewanella sp. OPT22]
ALGLQEVILKYILFSLFLSVNAFASNPCENTGERFSFGEEPFASKLYEAAKNTELGAWKDGEFWQERFYYLGTVQSGKNSLYVTYIDTSWGASSCRSTRRLIFFTKDFKQFAQYYAVAKPSLIGSFLDFPEGEREKTKIDISKELPEFLNDGNDYFPIQKM